MVVAVLAASTGDAAPLRPLTLTGTCVEVNAADEIAVWLGVEAQVVRVRLAGIDGSSIAAWFPRVAEETVRNRVLDRTVRVEVYDRRGDRVVVGRVLVGGEDLGWRLVAEGLARPHPRAPAALELDRAEDEARRHGEGMWYVPEEAVADEPVTTVAEPASLGDGDLHLGTWVGRHREVLVAGLGQPTRVEDDGRGGRVLVYGLCAEGLAPSAGPCTLRYTVDADGVVTSRRWE